jgi:hypothetical protein
MTILTTIAGLFKRKKKATPLPFDLEKWVRAFRKAPAQRKSEVAELWLEHYLSNIDGLSPWEAQTIEAVIRQTLMPKMADVRAMVAALRPDCPHWAENSTDSRRVKSLRVYLNMSKEVYPGEVPSYYAARLRIMILHEDLDTRLAALYEMVSAKKNLRGMHKGASSLLRAATWALAEEEGMPNALTSAATRLVVWSHLFQPLPFMSSQQPQCVAIETMLWRAQCGGRAYAEEMSTELIKRHLSAHPAAAATLLYYLETESIFTTRDEVHLHPRSASEDEKLETLLDWVPLQSGVVSMAQQLGLSYLGTLDQIMEGFNPQPVIELPLNIDLGI